MWIRPLVHLAVVVSLLTLSASQAAAHGEKSQEPFLRMRTVMWYDVVWSTDKLNVNEEMIITGKFHLFEEWPTNVVAAPTSAWLNVSVPGPQLIRLATYINGVAMVNSVSLELGRDYEFKVILKGRNPGRYHLHPMLNVEGGGPIAGPGQWVTVEGDGDTFTNPVTTLTGETIDLETYGLGRVISWHAITIGLGLAWILFWLRSPFLGRLLLVQGETPEGELVSKRDRVVGMAFLVAAVALVAGGYFFTEAQYPVTVPLQSGRTVIPPLEKPPQTIEATVERATYTVATRTFTMALQVTNTGEQPVQLGEMSAASIRFLNPQLFKGNHQILVEPQEPVQPGETKTLQVVASDAVWETEHLTMGYDPENRFAALLMFFDPQGSRRIIAVSAGPLIPQYLPTSGA
ncbi:MAG: bacterial ammonia monooxygenase, subunit AmoB [Candidatus Binatia bacterium]